MEFIVYILFSKSLQKYYVGHTSNVIKRLNEHNSGKSNFTSKGIPWIIIHNIPQSTKTAAMQLELKIKKRGAKRYLADIDFVS